MRIDDEFSVASASNLMFRLHMVDDTCVMISLSSVAVMGLLLPLKSSMSLEMQPLGGPSSVLMLSTDESNLAIRANDHLTSYGLLRPLKMS